MIIFPTILIHYFKELSSECKMAIKIIKMEENPKNNPKIFHNFISKIKKKMIMMRIIEHFSFHELGNHIKIGSECD